MIIHSLVDKIHNDICFSASSRDGYEKRLWGFWSDDIYTVNGEDYPGFNEENARKFANDKKFLELVLCYGQSGLEIYTLILHFGKKALSRNAKEKDLCGCVPDFREEPDTISIDTENKIVQIFLK